VTERHEPADDEVKRRFREALEKKHAHAGRDVSDHPDQGKVAGSRRGKGPGGQRMFRRKSG
jgi:hypothetical protein